ncbi:glycoside hydrolase family 32 protein [Carnobacterium sp. ISL-102]|uniref:glycoside hydrolase family 32 protein n=1 Tax=Carnobacterium sp. ISL-102 TaxID=2819142 RepID=UPI001BE897A9|nr:glycoside hydrolase family 32 protein [Carnobacterium sp. ISL-102]MBT2731899.1 glycoside hydrolase family 32 protein [Carnobacterium sp. ISL-102]
MKETEKVHDYELGYHITPPKGLLNDPNGLVHYKGVYHVFFQWNQTDTTHQSKSWGHVTTKDFIHWKSHKPALEPVDWYDKDGCYSGSAVVFKEKLYLFYTGNVRGEQGERSSYQCLAVSEDGIHFEKKGPILTFPIKGYTAHVRDPKVWQGEDGNWWMVLGAQKENLTGDVLMYQSTNLVDWTLTGSMLDEPISLGFMWECPDLLRFAEKDVFVFSPQGLEAEGEKYKNIYQTGYFTGRFLENGKFIKDNQPFEEMDHGFEFYAPQTFLDDSGRTILYGWAGVMEPEVEKAVPTIKQGWLHALTSPREVHYKNGQLTQYPLSETIKLREANPITSKNAGNEVIHLPSLQQDILIEWNSAAPDFVINLRNELDIHYQAETKKMTVTRTNWKTNAREERTAFLTHELTELRLLVESSLVELFLNKGEEVFTLRYFVDETNHILNFKYMDKPLEKLMTLYSLRSFQNE